MTHRLIELATRTQTIRVNKQTTRYMRNDCVEILIDQRAVAITKVDSAVALILIGSGVRFCETFRFYTMLSTIASQPTAVLSQAFLRWSFDNYSLCRVVDVFSQGNRNW